MGTNTRVISVPTNSPAIIATAIDPYMGSLTNGIIPNIVVNEAIVTGRTLDMVASITA